MESKICCYDCLDGVCRLLYFTDVVEEIFFCILYLPQTSVFQFYVSKIMQYVTYIKKSSTSPDTTTERYFFA